MGLYQRQYITVQFQDGPVGDVGVNGAQIEDVIDVALAELRALNEGEFRCRENSLAITDLESAQNWLYRRTRNRKVQGVEGQGKPHIS